MYVCIMYVCMYVCICVYACMYTCIYVLMYACTYYVGMYLRMYVFMYICMYVHMYVCLRLSDACLSVQSTSLRSLLPIRPSVRLSVCLSLNITLIGRKISEYQIAKKIWMQLSWPNSKYTFYLTILLEWPRRNMKTLSADSLCPASRRLIRSIAAIFRPMFVPVWPLHAWANWRHDTCCILGWSVSLPMLRRNMLLTYRAVGYCDTSGKICQITWCNVSKDIVFCLLALNNDVSSFLGFTYVYI